MSVKRFDISAEDTVILDIVRNDVNHILEEYYKKQSKKAAHYSPDYKKLWNILRAQQLAGGKRFRPYLCALAYQASGGDSYPDILPICAALEVLHTALLIHDDIIDRDTSRHGSLNIIGRYNEYYKKTGSKPKESLHFANSAAIIAGDLLISDAYQLIFDSVIEPELQIQIAKLLGEAIFAVGAGELLDTEAALFNIDRADSLKIAELKTASYSCAIPLRAGVMLAGGTEKMQATFMTIGENLGIGFQLADDLLGVFGDENQTGKSILSDIREGKRTLLLQQTLARSTSEQKKALREIIGNKNCDTQMAQVVRNIMSECGAKDAVENSIQKYANKAYSLVRSLDITPAYKSALDKFIESAVHRTQ